jgi:hypothetical protein
VGQEQDPLPQVLPQRNLIAFRLQFFRFFFRAIAASVRFSNVATPIARVSLGGN